MNWSYRRTVLALGALAYFGSRVGQLAISPLVPEITAAFDASTGAIGAALTGMWAAYALVQYPAGVLADRFGERPVVLVALAAAAAGAGVLAAVPTYPFFVLVVLLLGAGVGLYYNVGTALLARQFDDVGRAIGVHRVGGQAAGLVAPVAATAVSVRFGWRAGLLVGVAAAVPAFVLFRLGVRPTRPRRPGARVRDQFDPGRVLALLARPGLAYATVLAVLAEFVGMATMSFLPTFLARAHGTGLARASALFSLYFVVVGLAQPATGALSDRVGRDPATGLTMLAGTVGYGLLVAGSGGPLLVAGVVLAGYAMSWSAPVHARLVDSLGETEQGPGFGLVRTVYVLLGALGSVVVGVVADAAGWTVAFGLLGAVLLAASVLSGGAAAARSRGTIDI